MLVRFLVRSWGAGGGTSRLELICRGWQLEPDRGFGQRPGCCSGLAPGAPGSGATQTKTGLGTAMTPDLALGAPAAAPTGSAGRGNGAKQGAGGWFGSCWSLPTCIA